MDVRKKSGAFEHLQFEVKSFPLASFIGFLPDDDYEGIAAAVDAYDETRRIVGQSKDIKIFDPVVIARGDKAVVTDYVQNCEPGVSCRYRLTHTAVRLKQEMDLKTGIGFTEQLNSYTNQVTTTTAPILPPFGAIVYLALGMLVRNLDELYDGANVTVHGVYLGERFQGLKVKTIPIENFED